MLEAKRLNKAVVPKSLIDYPSPPNLQSTRLAVHDNGDASSCWVYIASGANIYKLRILMKNSLVGIGKESLLIPEQTQVLDSSLVSRCPHRSEIQSIALAETESMSCSILGSVDCYGHFIVSRLDVSNTDEDGFTYSVSPQDSGVGEGSWAGLCFNPSQLSMAAVALRVPAIVSRLDVSNTDEDGFTYSVSPQDSGVGEGSWAGLCFNPSQLSMAAVARSFCKSIDIYDRDIHLRTLRTLSYPYSLIFMENFGGTASSMLAITEGSQLSIWDLRVKENGGCVHRIMGSVGDMLYAVTMSSSGNIAAGGADRTVTVYDPRRWTAFSRWLNCSKYEITGLTFSSVDPDYIYVQGVDYEVLCGQWRESKKAFSFRGDSNWLGFSKCSNRDILAGWSDTGSIFVADVA